MEIQVTCFHESRHAFQWKVISGEYSGTEVVDSPMMQKWKDETEAIEGDINENFAKRSERSNKNVANDGSVRYHINVGRVDGLDAKTLVQLIRKQTRLNNSDISDVAISDKSAFFSTDQRLFERVMQGLQTITIKGRKTGVRVANNRPKSSSNSLRHSSRKGRKYNR